MVISGMSWMGAWLALIYVIGRGWLSAFAATAPSVVPLALGVGMIVAYRRYLGETDELRRKIEVDALAWRSVSVWSEPSATCCWNALVRW